jgi:hypothetical protein
MPFILRGPLFEKNVVLTSFKHRHKIFVNILLPCMIHIFCKKSKLFHSIDEAYYSPFYMPIFDSIP